MHGLATRARDKPTDLVDLWRCLEVANSAGISAADFKEREPAAAAERIKSLFTDRHGGGMATFAREQRLSVAAADQMHTRIVALMKRVLGL